MLIGEFIKALDAVVPLPSAGYERDAVGLQIGLPEHTALSGALFAYEVTDEIVAEAVQTHANLIVAFHPLIFPSLVSITDSTRTGKLAAELIRSGIALYVLHTAFDTQIEFGTSKLMAESLGLRNIRPLKPLENSLNKIVVFAPKADSLRIIEALAGAGAGTIGNYEECAFQSDGIGTFRGNSASNPTIGKPTVLEQTEEVRIEMVCERWNTNRAIREMIESHPYEQVAYDIVPVSTPSPNFGMGAIGEWEPGWEVLETLAAARKAFGVPFLRHNRIANERISRVAVLGGAGMEYYSAAVRAGAEAFITADVRYHDFYRAEHDNVLLIDAGHAETERFVPEGMLAAARRALDLAGFGNKRRSGDEIGSELLRTSRNRPNAVSYF